MWRKYNLVICEKPAAAERIATALGDKEILREEVDGVPIYRVVRGRAKLVIVPALGHLYTLTQDGGAWTFPVFNLKWTPMYTEVQNEDLAKKLRNWINVISSLSKRASMFISACDYDIEGSVIAYTILRFACNNGCPRARRMKFSTLTKKDIVRAYERMMKELDYPLINAGIIRHSVDWLFGVNVSRVLMTLLKEETGKFEILSAGRVQSPTLYALARREVAIKTHVPIPYWTIEADILVNNNILKASYHQPRIGTLKDAHAIKERCEGSLGVVKRVEKRVCRRRQPSPFNLSALQTEAYRLFGFSPLKTQAIAERLYLDALISYPRTSSQRLPPSISYEEILTSLQLNPAYQELALGILSRGNLQPTQGKSDDPAHPAIHPTGNLPKRTLERDEAKIYDLIVRRFLASFADYMIREHVKLVIEFDQRDVFNVYGSRMIREGWLRYYPYASISTNELPQVKVGDEARLAKLIVHERFSQPKPRFNPGGLLKFMEKHNLGTKSTRAEIIDTLYRRGYIQGEKISVTELGFEVVNALRRLFPELTSIKLTRELEKQMDDVERGLSTPKNVMFAALEHLKLIFERALTKTDGLGARLLRSVKKARYSQEVLGKCPSCGKGNLIIIVSRRTKKRFIGCSRYSEGCKFGLPLPQRGLIQPTGSVCKLCSYPVVRVKGLGPKPWRLCVNPACPSKKSRGE